MGAKIKFYTDEHIGRAVVNGLRQRGVEVLTTQEAGTLGASDVDQLARASTEGRTLVTHDADFLRLAAAGVDHAVIVYAHQQTPIGVVISGLMLIHQLLDADEMLRHVEFL